MHGEASQYDHSLILVCGKGSRPLETSISHLFFADDLLLFTQANDQHCDMIKDIMNEFSDISGLKIHFQKSSMYVSPNLERGRANGLRWRSGIPITQDLGKYLGVPLFHERVNKRNFNSIIEKMQKRLTGFQANTLFYGWEGHSYSSSHFTQKLATLISAGSFPISRAWCSQSAKT
jgi:hypothetical protein